VVLGSPEKIRLFLTAQNSTEALPRGHLSSTDGQECCYLLSGWSDETLAAWAFKPKIKSFDLFLVDTGGIVRDDPWQSIQWPGLCLRVTLAGRVI